MYVDRFLMEKMSAVALTRTSGLCASLARGVCPSNAGGCCCRHTQKAQEQARTHNLRRVILRLLSNARAQIEKFKKQLQNTAAGRKLRAINVGVVCCMFLWVECSGFCRTVWQCSCVCLLAIMLGMLVGSVMAMQNAKLHVAVMVRKQCEANCTKQALHT